MLSSSRSNGLSFQKAGKGGRPKATSRMNVQGIACAKQLYAARENTIAEIMQMTGFKSRSRFYKYVVDTSK
jgi:AraC-like DNA-binding protein